MSREVVLRVEDLTVKLGEVEILRDVSFNVTRGEFVGIIGPNGAGKSTLIRAILGQVPYSGYVGIYGSVGYVPQLPTFNREFPLTVYEFVKLPVRKERDWKEKVEKALESVGMKEFGSKLVGQLSGGQFQRIALARAIVSQPDILLLDEPESGIDEMGKAKFYDLIDELRETRGVTIIMVSHDIGLIFKKCTTIMCLNKTLHCHGPSKEISPLEIKRLFGEFDIWIRSDDHFEVEHRNH
ncbi:metal ABC transporter ATP-binding protein [Fervidobacterium thailandense]|uniref:Metal ABC transporter ATP-binding protein n=1 Tax=Fervidobacterium thailandense TaxID=1008305 RepID=A0A1E3G3C8_9BACT|nr:metal ABC transporter ATP-binding protein [Fervidobacterium thailandense]ODN30188.1 metal ABC transporter ATP-binding protein [Fervidobacterium thailandense]